MEVYQGGYVAERFCHICHTTMLDILGRSPVILAYSGLGELLERALRGY